MCVYSHRPGGRKSSCGTKKGGRQGVVYQGPMGGKETPTESPHPFFPFNLPRGGKETPTESPHPFFPSPETHKEPPSPDFLSKTGRPCSAHRSRHLCQMAKDTRKEHIRTTPDGKTQYHPRTCRWMHESLPSDERCQDLPEQFIESATLMQIPEKINRT